VLLDKASYAECSMQHAASHDEERKVGYYSHTQFRVHVIQKLIQDAMASYTAPASWLDERLTTSHRAPRPCCERSGRPVQMDRHSQDKLDHSPHIPQAHRRRCALPMTRPHAHRRPDHAGAATEVAGDLSPPEQMHSDGRLKQHRNIIWSNGVNIH
jgi:hypothetical protein